jgi:hypothetical protein
MEALKAISIILAILCAGIIVLIGIKTNLLRESNNTNPPYSFARFQLWLWTLVISPLFILNWGYNSQTEPELNVTCLILLGISVTGTLTSGIITNVHDSNIRKDSNGKPKAGEELIKKYRDSKSFWIDILIDDSGHFSVTRLQQLIFTIAYVFIFISSFFSNNMVYPEFQDSAFILMGISAGTYLVGKGMKK